MPAFEIVNALDPMGAWFEEELSAEVYDSHVFQQSSQAEPLKKTCKWSKVSDCCRRWHHLEPLHHIKKWNGECFISTTLHEIGLRVQLNHTNMRCRAPVPAHTTFKVLHTTGIHDVVLDYCGCEGQLPYHTQLLRRGWYPASHRVPTTCTTFHLLEFLHILSLCSKVSIYDFFWTLEKLLWVHLKMLKRNGWAHVNDGVATTTPGELALLCPSCLQPGINLPEGWESAPPEYQQVSLYDNSMHGCEFPAEESDPGLGIGWAYFVPKKEYDEYIHNHTSDEDFRLHASGLLPWQRLIPNFRRVFILPEWGLCLAQGASLSSQL
ncbi:hypothetical protein ARMGADRAFT_1038202 [Armillaria gallica]|uniref:CxC2-like cysteine cluster KDZ transposase-associated domain-containing protein n=1 Tax=Armillaria gallica TaxID=47427 RepID=A0A2H3CIY6_ARMGA|nr:hypothetical protein ARMGADRAFT_1038202 [Armillaria gallica]